jgi:hypothetical protein
MTAGWSDGVTHIANPTPAEKDLAQHAHDTAQAQSDWEQQCTHKQAWHNHHLHHLNHIHPHLNPPNFPLQGTQYTLEGTNPTSQLRLGPMGTWHHIHQLSTQPFHHHLHHLNHHKPTHNHPQTTPWWTSKISMVLLDVRQTTNRFAPLTQTQTSPPMPTPQSGEHGEGLAPNVMLLGHPKCPFGSTSCSQSLFQ